MYAHIVMILSQKGAVGDGSYATVLLVDDMVHVAVGAGAAAAGPLAHALGPELDRPPDRGGNRLAEADVEDNGASVL
jgi:hypothetical protein